MSSDEVTGMRSTSSGSDSDALSDASSGSIQSGSETYVQGIGSPVKRDPSDAPYPVIERATIQRTYDSSSSNENDDDDDDNESNDNESDKEVHTVSIKELPNKPVENGMPKLKCRPQCDRSRALKTRVDKITKELAGLQVITASRAADADVLKSMSTDATSDGLLNGEVCRLRITLDHVTRLALENAFALRDQLETPR